MSGTPLRPLRTAHPLEPRSFDATASVAGTFAYTPAAGTVLATGSQILSVTFTPTDSTDYATASSIVTLTVNKATPTITWATPAAIMYGTMLSAAQLDATSSTRPVTFSYSPLPGALLAAGQRVLMASFTPTDTSDYNSTSATVTLTVNKATPTITWSTPAAVAVGTALTSAQLNAAPSVLGTLVYTPPARNHHVHHREPITLSTSFTPNDTVDYNDASATTTLTVDSGPPPAFAVTGNAITIQPGATTGNTSTIAVTPSNGFTGTVSLSCNITPAAANDPATCNILPSSVTISGTTPQTATLTVSTTLATALNHPFKLFWPSAGGATLALVFLFKLPRRRPQRLAGDARPVLPGLFPLPALAAAAAALAPVEAARATPAPLREPTPSPSLELQVRLSRPPRQSSVCSDLPRPVASYRRIKCARACHCVVTVKMCTGPSRPDGNSGESAL